MKKNVISKSGVYAVANRTLTTRKPESVALMRKYGMKVSEADSAGKIDKAFFALLPRSRAFRNDFSQLASEVAADMSVGELSMTGYLNISGAGLKQQKFDNEPTTVATKLDTTPKTKDTKTKNAPKAFEDTKVGQVLSNDTIKNLLNTGLSVWAYKRTGGGVSGSYQDNLLSSATLGGTQAPPKGNAVDGSGSDKDPQGKGADLGWLVFVGVAAVAVGAGFLVYRAARR